MLAVPDDFHDGVKVRGAAKVDLVEVNEAWIESAIGDDWMVAYRLMPQAGHFVIAELRLFPRESHANRNPGEWSGVYLGTGAAVPNGGVSATLLRSVHLGDRSGSDLAEGRTAWLRYIGLSPKAKAAFARAGFRKLRRPRPERGGRRGWPEAQLLEAAAFYVRVGGRAPVAALAKQWGLAPTVARDLLQVAKEKGFLTAGRQGVASRALTDRAKKLLAGNRE